ERQVVAPRRASGAAQSEGRPRRPRAEPRPERRQRAADIEAERGEDEAAAGGIDRKGVDADQDARADQESADHRHREGDHREHHRPGPQAVARGEHAHRMQQRGRGQPGHQRSILHRSPEPPAAPAALVLGPIAPGGEARREGKPGRQHPGGP
ncbi:hypothetical protein QU38_01865, partial [Staphylococcus aureus]